MSVAIHLNHFWRGYWCGGIAGILSTVIGNRICARRRGVA